MSVSHGNCSLKLDLNNTEVVLLGPEERNRAKCFPTTKNVACRGLTLTLSHDKMFDADSFAGERIGPAGDVAGGEDLRDAGLRTSKNVH
jgi:hypothetical protein